MTYSNGRSGLNLKSILDIIASVTMILAAGAIAWTVLKPAPAVLGRRPAVPVPTETLSLANVSTIGDGAAKVVVLEFSDFQCPFCAKFAKETWPSLKKEYVDTGRVQVGFRHLPLTKIHPLAERAAEAASCAGQQGRFWEMHDALFVDQEHLAEDALFQRARTLALDQSSFSTCMQGAEKPRVAADAELAGHLKFSGTPTFVIGRIGANQQITALKVLPGALPIADFRKALDEVLKQVGATE